MRQILAAGMVVLASSAVAQTSTTNCTTPYLGSIQCTTQHPQRGLDPRLMAPVPNAGQAFNDAYQRGLRERHAREMAKRQAEAAQAGAEAAQAQTNALQAQQQADETHRAQSLEAAKFVSAGDCAGGQTYALSVGNFALAQQIKDYCGK